MDIVNFCLCLLKNYLCLILTLRVKVIKVFDKILLYKSKTKKEPFQIYPENVYS